MNVHRLLRTVESFDAVDGPADTVAESVERALTSSGIGPLIRGSWLGHPVHPLLVMLPLGSWLSSVVFDVGFGDRTTARRLLAIGLAATPPTVLTGLADFASLRREQRRVGAVHAVVNTAGVGFIALAYRAHRRDRTRRATTYSLLGLGLLGVGGALGGHLSYAQGGGVHRWQAAGPAELRDYIRPRGLTAA